MDARVLILLVLVVFGQDTVASESKQCDIRLQNCTMMVQPFLDDFRYMFPTTVRDVEVMCRMWSQFVECVRQYMAQCSSERQRSKFHLAVENSIDTVHAICSSDRYQKDYLTNAECFKHISVDMCGSYYSQMVNQVTNTNSNDEHICCAFSQFHSCAKELLEAQCSSRAQALLEHSMNFFASRCGKQYYSLAYLCPTASPQVEELAYVASMTTQIPTVPPQTTPLTATPFPWSVRTVIYSLPPSPGSRTSNGQKRLSPLNFLTVLMMIFCMHYLVLNPVT